MRFRTGVATLALLMTALVLVGCSVREVRRADVVGLWTHPGDPSQSVEIRSDGTFLIRNVSLGALNGRSPSPSAPYRQSGRWLLEPTVENRGHYLLLHGVNAEGKGFAYSFPIVGSGSNATIYLPLGGQYEGRRFEFQRAPS